MQQSRFSFNGNRYVRIVTGNDRAAQVVDYQTGEFLGEEWDSWIPITDRAEELGYYVVCMDHHTDSDTYTAACIYEK